MAKMSFRDDNVEKVLRVGAGARFENVGSGWEYILAVVGYSSVENDLDNDLVNLIRLEDGGCYSPHSVRVVDGDHLTRGEWKVVTRGADFKILNGVEE